MAQEYAFDRLARVFDAAAANYVAEDQRKTRLADERNYAKSIRDDERNYSADVRDEGRTYAETQHGKARTEQVEDDARQDHRALVNELVRGGLIAPADINDPAKVAAAATHLSPAAKQRLADFPNLLKDVRDMASTTDMSAVLKGRNLEDLSYEELASVAGSGRSVQADQAKIYGEEGAALRVKLEGAQAAYDLAVSQTDLLPTPEESQAAESQLNPSGKNDEGTQMLVQARAEEIAKLRAVGAKSRADSLGRTLSSLTTQMRLLETSARNKTPYQRTPVAPPPPEKPLAPPDTRDAMEIMLDPDGSKARARAAKAKASVGGGIDQRNHFAAKAAQEAAAAQQAERLRSFGSIYAGATTTDDAIAKQIDAVRKPPSGFRSPFDAGFSPLPSELTTEEKSERMQRALATRDSTAEEAKQLGSAIIAGIESVPAEQRPELLRQLASLGITPPAAAEPTTTDVSAIAKMLAQFSPQSSVQPVNFPFLSAAQ